MPSKKLRFVTACQQLLVLGAVIAVLTPAANVISLDVVPPGPSEGLGGTGLTAGDQDGPSEVETAPVTPVVEEFEMDAVSTARAVAESPELADNPPVQGFTAGTDTSNEAISASEPVEGYAAVGVTWDADEEVADDEIAVMVRTRTDDEWTDWTPVDYHDEHGPDVGSTEARNARPGTDPMLVGEVDEVQAKAVTTSGVEVPKDMKLAVVAPGTSKATAVEEPALDTAAPTPGATSAPSVAASPDAGATSSTPSSTPDEPTEPATPTQVEPSPSATISSDQGDLTLQAAVSASKPQIYSRAQWGANEKLRDPSSLHYGSVSAGFVHHTVNANDYTRDQVPGIIRSIYAYHTQSRGWSDIGYNFLVDKFGRIWEGRYGGVDRAVVGAHTLGYNDYSFAMSAIGNFDITQPPEVMLDAYGRLFAWKLSLSNVSASSTKQRVGSRTLPAINGHRDVGSTACPGKYLYARIGDIRKKAAAYQTGTPPAETVEMNEFGDAFTEDYVGGLGWQRYDTVITTRDMTGDKIDDVVIRSATSGDVAVRAGDGKGRYGGHVDVTSAFRGTDQITAVGNFDGAGRADLVAREPMTGFLYLYPAASAPGTFGPRELIATGWGNYDLTVGIGDGNGDGRPDIYSRDTNGTLWFHANAGDNKLKAPVKALGVTSRFDVITGSGDLTGDAKADLVVRNEESSRVSIYTGNGTGTFTTYVGPVLSGFTLPFVMGDVDNDDKPDLLAVRGNDMVGFKNSGAVGTPVPTPEPVPDPEPGPEPVPDNPDWWFGPQAVQAYSGGAGWERYDTVIATQDMTGDRIDDVVIRSAASGDAAVRAGDGKGRYGFHVKVTSVLRGMDQITAVGNFNGSGRADLVAREPRTGRLYLYPAASAAGTFGSRVLLSGAWSGYDLTVGIGDANGDGRPDIYSRDANGNLWFHANAGGSKLNAPVRALANTSRFDVITGAGDLSGDGKADLVVRNKVSSRVSIYTGLGDGSFRTYIGPVLADFKLPFTMGDINKDGKADLVSVHGNDMVVFKNRSNATDPLELKFGPLTTQAYSGGAGWQRYDTVVATQDVTGDKIDDVTIRSSYSGDIAVRAGDGKGRFGNHIKVSTAMRGMDQITPVQDFDNFAGADLVARDPKTGYLYLFQGGCVPGQYEKKILLSKAWGSYNLTAGIGDANGDGRPDIYSRDRNGDLWFHANAGNNTLKAPVKVMSNTARFDVITGAGDLDGDRKADLVVRNSRSNWVSVYPGQGNGRFDAYIGPLVQVTGLALPFTLGDVNHDGMVDIVGIKGNNMVTYLNKSTR